MGSEKRERQKANRAQRQIEQAPAERVSSVRRNAVRWGIGVIVALGAVVLIAWVGGAFDGDDESLEIDDDDAAQVETGQVDTGDATVDAATGATDDATTGDATGDAATGDAATGDATGAPAAGSVPEQADPSECPATDGSEEQRREFDAYPPFCIDVDAEYTAEVVTNLGDLTIELHPDRAPLAVNSFVTLANYHYFDGTECHRIIPDFVVQCGDPTGTGRGGPGYQFADELPEAGDYEIGSVAMANSGADTNGSQFFLISGPDGAALPPQYTLFGTITDGLDTTLPALDAAGNPENDGVPPLEQVVIESVTIHAT